MEEKEAKKPIKNEKDLSLQTEKYEDLQLESLFPLKIDIPDNEIYLGLKCIFKNTEFVFLFSSEVEFKDIKIVDRNNIYFLGDIKKNGKTFSIFYIEVYDNQNLTFKINIPKFTNPFFVKIDKDKYKLRDVRNKLFFLFNESLYDKDNKVIQKLNCFDIYEEFEIFYRIHNENKNANSLKFLYSSIENLIKDNKREESNFSFILKILMKEYLPFKEYIFIILRNVKNIGDLSKISKEELYKFTFSGKNEKYKELYIIYIILSKNIKELERILFIDNNLKPLVFLCLKEYKPLFSHSLKLYPDYFFLINLSSSFKDIEIILECSKNFKDFIYFIDAKKEDILKYINENNKIIIDEIFRGDSILENEFDEEFYFSLNKIKEFEIKNKKNNYVFY